MKRFILLLLLVALAGGTAWAGVRLDLDSGIVSGSAAPLNGIDADLEGQTGGEASFVFLGEGAAIQTPSLTALLVVSHASVTTLDTVTFDASGSLPGDGVIILYEWDLNGDGVFEATSSSDVLEHVYTDDGVAFVQVRVTNNLGESTLSEALRLDVVNRSPKARFEVNLGDRAEDSFIQFADHSHDVDGAVSSWAWDFGDGTTSGGINPIHSYAAGGVFKVALSVTDNDGAISDAYVLEIEILNTGPLVGFTQQQSSVKAGQSLILIDESIDPSENGEIVHVAWDFGDGTHQAGGPSSDNVYSHVFTTPGTYTITLYVIDNNGGMARIQSAVEVL
ncbi:PKD domain-containing protein [Candidatus Bipolaricaulota bacterium]